MKQTFVLTLHKISGISLSSTVFTCGVFDCWRVR